MTSVGMVWRRIIIALGGDVSRREIFVWYQLGQMAKYLPGGVWPLKDWHTAFEEMHSGRIVKAVLRP